MTTRRDFLTTAATLAALPSATSAFASAPDPWAEAAAIAARIKPPKFPRRDFPITAFGAKGDGTTLNTDAFAAAIAACNAAGGGRVVVPPGAWLTGAIHLKSNVNLYLAEDARIKFSRDPAHYLPLVFTRWEGVECMNYSPFIYAFEQENIAITGHGTIDGQASREFWWPWKGLEYGGWRPGQPKQDAARAKLFQMAEDNVPVSERVFGVGSYLRPMFIQPYRCRNVLIEGVSLTGSPMWQIHPVLCTNLTVRKMKIVGDGPNTDGCDPESCTDVLIEDCFFDTGDDCIAINSGRNADGRRLKAPCQNVVIRDCRMANGHGALTVGSQISGGVRNVFAENCRLDSPKLDAAVRVKNNALRGGVLEHLHFRNLAIGQVAQAVISVEFDYEEGPNGPYTPVLRDLTVENVVCEKTRRPMVVRAYASADISEITVRNCDFKSASDPSQIAFVKHLIVEHVKVNGAPSGLV
jgi:polygalacturonase